jgi:hypothetical protein
MNGVPTGHRKSLLTLLPLQVSFCLLWVADILTLEALPSIQSCVGRPCDPVDLLRDCLVVRLCGESVVNASACGYLRAPTRACFCLCVCCSSLCVYGSS